jgi:choline dehydrogenase
MHLLKFFLLGSGLFISIISEYFCYLHSTKLPPRDHKPTRDLPDLEMFWTAASINPSFSNSPFPKGRGGGSIMIQNSVPSSFGTVRLTPDGANDIKVDPIVDPRHLSDPADWLAYRRGLKFARKIGAEMRRGGYDVVEDRFPKTDQDVELDAYIREHGLSSQHLLSSCRMKKLEEGGVVDFKLKVYGIQGLRIADGSVIPGMVASRPQATVVMVAERCAEFIRSGWKDKVFGEMARY